MSHLPRTSRPWSNCPRHTRRWPPSWARSSSARRRSIEQLLTAIFCRGHCLLVGVPGLAKTLMVSTIATILDLSLQAHPVHARPDAVGHHRHGRPRRRPHDRQARVPVRARARSSRTSCWPTKSTARRRRRRPRCSKRCRSARSPSGEQTYELPEPFFVLATQNPIEQEGTYPLPEAQLDRFMFMIDRELSDAAGGRCRS